jgi:hypothetical protein
MFSISSAVATIRGVVLLRKTLRILVKRELLVGLGIGTLFGLGLMWSDWAVLARVAGHMGVPNEKGRPEGAALNFSS